MAKTSKKNKPLREKLVEEASYNLEEALDILFEHKSEKFTESVDVSINLGVDPSKSDQNALPSSRVFALAAKMRKRQRSKVSTQF